MTWVGIVLWWDQGEKKAPEVPISKSARPPGNRDRKRPTKCMDGAGVAGCAPFHTCG